MNAPSPLALEMSIARKIHEDPSIIGDQARFDDLCEPYYAKSSAIKAMKAYLSGHDSAPRVLGCLIYSRHGLREIKSWVESGMPVSLLYRTMLHDGGAWRDYHPKLLIANEIIQGDDQWDFDYRLLAEAIYPDAIVPGLMEAIVARAIKRDQIKSMVSILPQNRLSSLIEAFPEAFEVAVSHLGVSAATAPAELARKLCSKWLPPERSILKMLLHTA